MKNQNYCYLLYAVKDDLPVGCFDDQNEIMCFLEVGRTTIYHMLKNHAIVRGCYLEKVYL